MGLVITNDQRLSRKVVPGIHFIQSLEAMGVFQCQCRVVCLDGFGALHTLERKDEYILAYLHAGDAVTVAAAVLPGLVDERFFQDLTVDVVRDGSFAELVEAINAPRR